MSTGDALRVLLSKGDADVKIAHLGRWRFCDGTAQHAQRCTVLRIHGQESGSVSRPDGKEPLVLTKKLEFILKAPLDC